MSIVPPALPPKSGPDLESLAATLPEAFANGGEEAVKTLLAKALSRSRMAARARLEAGAKGHAIAGELSRGADAMVQALFQQARSQSAEADEPMAILAVGGYGRGELAPFSDLDLLFLRPGKLTPFVRGVTGQILHALWDLGLKVGQASRTVEESLKLAREDVTIQTTLLDARLLAGDAALADTHLARFRKEVASRDHAGYIAAKLCERDERHARIGAARYMVEPNLKEGKGGLRDLHTLFWMARRRYGFAAPQAYLDAGVFTPEDYSLFRRALGFLWTVRCHLHFLAGRAEERLTFDVQPELARRLGFNARGGHSAAERFMKRYFLTAKEVGALTRVLCAKLEADHSKNAPQGLRRFLPVRKTALTLPAPGFHIEAGRLNLDGPEVLEAPANIMRLFEIAESRDLDVHPEALRIVARRARRIGPSWRNDEAARQAFLNIISSSRHPGAALRLMNDAGVLERFVPEFGAIVGRMQFNMYHHYTVDEHTLQAIDTIAEIEQGRHKEQHPLATSIFAKIINRRALYLAMLLHDTGKGDGDQQIDGEIAALAACERLGLPREEVELVGWLVRHHLVMSETAQKRDVADPRTVAHFTRIVGNVERLRLLLVLTVADMRAVGPGVWNDWKGQLLRDLYRFTEATLHGGCSDEEEVRAHQGEIAAEAKQSLRAGMTQEDGALGDWLATLEDGYWFNHDADALAWHAREMTAAHADRAIPHVAARVRAQQGVTEIMVYAHDRSGLFASLAAAISASGADIAGARVHTTKDGAAFDIFSIQTTHRRPFGEEHPRALETLLRKLERAAVEDHAPPAAATPSRRLAAFAIEPWVRIDNEATAQASVIEASGRDRPGLLAELARACAEANVSIVSAHIDTAGARACDVFYVQELGGGQIANVRRGVGLRNRLEAVLRAGESAEPSDASAPASTRR